ncbi:uncharacterized protein L969DRAFT_82242 [Mixia osmundae IAM 14324]|uniref:uncharacterized protein n=1 Tax=Mixia osmundae (strain CBS 9802 / IAM 14324 / JCM 22182 / KY 12970) TaxID=764103 RepID=UPI0004A55801|nr:uncharacterized protein L969DRAFT_82242 [Mixia osmundae IAM 14324]KEI39547.1 hypothetical protein L969DRAFT_82242 [Mixia osmundae IAM 14324]
MGSKGERLATGTQAYANGFKAELAAREPERHDVGKTGSHNPQDAKDERSIANRLSAANTQNDDGDAGPKQPPTKAALDVSILSHCCAGRSQRMQHGNKPSKGAIIDEQIEAEEQAELAKKGIKP